ncbi:hypothetical protein [Palleronia caenipelagi]|uniref:Uncharacterized protein n=1 Tax=Palleronia caenipelagi TaxID=2489174 RepID=A0A547PS95_9RHOB|nr:hypothetical protein [Palleronia caenipelagi]TRD16961.1 hypothetical protein FEV53_13575 [Palleronia caenipelagi]
MDAELRAELMAEVDDAFAEAIRHLPMAQGRPDPARLPSEIVAILRTGDREAEGLGLRGRARTRVGINAEGGTLRIDRMIHGDLILRASDKVVALERPGQPIFEVQAVDDRSHLRLICELGDVN